MSKPNRAARLRRIKRDAEECLIRLERLRQDYPLEFEIINEQEGMDKRKITDYSNDIVRDIGNAMFRCKRAIDLAVRQLETMREPVAFHRAKKEKPVGVAPALEYLFAATTRDRIEDENDDDRPSQREEDKVTAWYAMHSY